MSKYRIASGYTFGFTIEDTEGQKLFFITQLTQEANIEVMWQRLQHFIDLANRGAEPKTAEDIIHMVRNWLDADDATHWGTFEKRLDELCRYEDIM